MTVGRETLSAVGTETDMMRVGMGYDVHRLTEGRDLIIGGVKIPYEIAPRRAGDADRNYADASKAFREMGWKAEKDLEDMCKDTWRWQSNNPNGY